MKAATYLGDNTVPILRALAERLGLTFDESALRDSEAAKREAGLADLVWICGHLTTTMLASDQLDAEIVAAPVFAGEPGPVYRSVLIARHDGPTDLASALSCRVAVNEPDSWSGHHGLRSFLRFCDPAELTIRGSGSQNQWFADEVESGAHRESIAMVAGGAADVAGIDHTIWQNVARTEPGAVANLQIIATTGDWPAPPFSVATKIDEPTRTSLIDALTSIGPGQIDGLDGIVSAIRADYDSLAF